MAYYFALRDDIVTPRGTNIKKFHLRSSNTKSSIQCIITSELCLAGALTHERVVIDVEAAVAAYKEVRAQPRKKHRSDPYKNPTKIKTQIKQHVCRCCFNKPTRVCLPTTRRAPASARAP